MGVVSCSMAIILVCQWSDLLFLYLIVGEVLLVLLPALTGRGRLGRLVTTQDVLAVGLTMMMRDLGSL